MLEMHHQPKKKTQPTKVKNIPIRSQREKREKHSVKIHSSNSNYKEKKF